MRLKHQARTRSAQSQSAMLRSLDFIPQPEKTETFKGFELVSDSCLVYNPFSGLVSKGYTGKRRKRLF